MHRLPLDHQPARELDRSQILGHPPPAAGLAPRGKTDPKAGKTYYVIAAPGGMLGERLNHDAQTELNVAAGEQRKITRLRLEKLIWQ